MLTRRTFLQNSAFSLVGAQFAIAKTAEHSDAVVTTPLGKLQGVVTDEAIIFRGVPFAQPPIGELRFRPRVLLKSWRGVRDATQFAPSAIQPGSGHIPKVKTVCI